MATTNELVAAERGYPGTLLGFTPNDRAYWREPGLLPIAYLPNEAIEGPTDEFIFVTDRMAPRFPDGTVVGLEPVASRQDLVVGRVYVQLVNNAGEYPVGRLARVGRTSLELTQDNHSATLTWSLGAEEQTEMQDLYEVTCYSLYLPHDEARLPESPVNDARPLLLEIATDAMAPRYPLGSRYFIRPVPPGARRPRTGTDQRDVGRAAPSSFGFSQRACARKRPHGRYRPAGNARSGQRLEARGVRLHARGVRSGPPLGNSAIH
jgi:hypothetical protein